MQRALVQSFATAALLGQETGKRLWYEHYELRIAKVERAYAKAT